MCARCSARSRDQGRSEALATYTSPGRRMRGLNSTRAQFWARARLSAAVAHSHRIGDVSAPRRTRTTSSSNSHVTTAESDKYLTTCRGKKSRASGCDGASGRRARWPPCAIPALCIRPCRRRWAVPAYTPRSRRYWPRRRAESTSNGTRGAKCPPRPARRRQKTLRRLSAVSNAARWVARAAGRSRWRR